MNLEQLKEALKAGTITLAQFKEQAKAWLVAQLASKVIDQAAHDAQLAEVEATTEGGGAGGEPGTLTAEQVQEMINKATQAAEDRVRTQYAKKLTAAEEEAERLRREKMTEEEKAKDDLAKAQKALEDQKAELERQRVELHTITALGKANVPVVFKDFLVADTVENTDKRIADFQTLWATALNDAVTARFKDAGTDPNKGNKGGGGAVNPWKPETVNYFQQAKILRENPTLAAQLKAAAGVK